MTRVCSGELGDRIWWEPQFTVIERAQELLCRLEEVDVDSIDWNHIVGDDDYFELLPQLTFPPLYNIEELMDLGGFDVDVNEPEVERPRMTFMQVEVSLAAEEVKKTLEHFKGLVERLEAYEPLRPFL